MEEELTRGTPFHCPRDPSKRKSLMKERANFLLSTMNLLEDAKSIPTQPVPLITVQMDFSTLFKRLILMGTAN